MKKYPKPKCHNFLLYLFSSFLLTGFLKIVTELSCFGKTFIDMLMPRQMPPKLAAACIFSDPCAKETVPQDYHDPTSSQLQ